MSSLLAAGDEVPADGRIVEASALADRRVGPDRRERAGVEGRRDSRRRTISRPGDQTNMAFMHTPVTHGSGVMIVTATGSDTQVGKIAGMLATTDARADAADQAAEHADAVDRGGGRGDDGRDVRARGAARPVRDGRVHERGRARDRGDPGGDADGAPGDPVARRRRPRQARSGAEGPRLGRDAGLDLGDQLRQDRNADHEPDDRGRGASIRPTATRSPARATSSRARSTTRPGSSDTIDDAILPYVVASDAQLVDGKVVGDPTEGALLVLAHKAGLDIDATRERLPAAGHAAVRPDLQADGDVHQGHRRVGQGGRALLRQGRRAGGDEPRRERAVRRPRASRGTTTCARAPRRTCSGWARPACA